MKRAHVGVWLALLAWSGVPVRSAVVSHHAPSTAWLRMSPSFAPARVRAPLSADGARRAAWPLEFLFRLTLTLASPPGAAGLEAEAEYDSVRASSTQNARGRAAVRSPRIRGEISESATAAHALLALGLFALLVLGARFLRERRERRDAERLNAGLGADREALATAHLLHRAVLDHAPFGVIATSVEGPITVFNAAAERMLGYNRDEVVGRRWGKDFVAPEQIVARAVELSAEIGRRVEAGREVFITRPLRGEVEEREWLAIRKDGRRVPAMLRITAMRDSLGRLTGFLGLLRDLTEERQAEEALRESEERFRLAFDHAGIGVGLLTHPDARWGRVNRALCDMLGYEAAELERMGTLELTHPDDVPRVAEMAAKLVADEFPVMRIEKRYRHRDGRYLWVRSTSSIVRERDGSPKYAITQIEDVTAGRETEETLRAQMSRLVRHEAALISLARRGMVRELADVPAALRHLTEASARALEVARVGIWRCLPSGVLRCVDLFELTANRHSEGAGLVMSDYPAYFRALTERDVIAADDACADSGTAEFAEGYLKPNGIVSMLDVPVSVGGSLAGVLCHEHVGAPRRWASDERAFAVAVGHLITLVLEEQERIQAQEALRRSRQAYKELVNTVDGIVWEVDARTFRFTFVSQQAERILGYPVESWLSEPEFWSRHIHAEDRDWAINYCVTATREKRDHDFTYRMIAADGREVWLHDVVTVVVENDEPSKLRGIMVDVSESKRTEEALRESEERFRQAFEHAGVGMALLSMDGRWLRVNRVLCDMLGYDADALKLTTCRELTYPGDGTLGDAAFAQLVAGDIPAVQLEKRYRRADGTYLWAHLTSTVVRSSTGEALHYVSQIEDISRRKQLEHDLRAARDDALEAARLKSEFLANMSHEIRTPMNGILGMAELLGETVHDDTHRDMLSVIRESGQTLLTIINDILDFSKIEAGRMRIEPVDFNLSDAIENTVALLAPQAQRKGLELACEIAPELDTGLNGDVTRIRQVLTNLLGNAIKFTERGRAAVSAQVRQATENDVRFRITVSDTGIGIDPIARPRLFQPFSQLDAGTTRRFGGTGLGLAISRQFVESMGGEIDFTSEEGAGSTFWFELTLPRQSPSRYAPNHRPPTAGAKPVAALRLLVVDDNEVNRLVASHMLAHLGHRVELAGDGVHAMQMLAAERYDAVFMDCQMPGMDGYEATRRIRAGAVPGIDPAIPVIALTAYAMADERTRGLEVGMNDYITKPFKPADVTRTLRRLGLAEVEESVEPPPPAMDDRVDLDQLSALAHAAGESRTLAAALLEEFLKQAPSMLAELTGAWKERNAVRLGGHAHRLSGSAASIGAKAVRAAAGELEQAANDSDWPRAGRALTRIEHECERLRADPQPWLNPS